MSGRPLRAEPLSVRAIVEAALRLARDVGLEDVTMRALARELDVSLGAVYHHVAGQSELTGAVVDHVLSLVPDAGQLTGTPRDRITGHVRALQRALDDNPGLTAAVIARAPDSPHAAVLRAGLRRELRGAGLTQRRAASAYLAIEWLWLGSRSGTGRGGYDGAAFDRALSALLDGLLGTASRSSASHPDRRL